MEDTRGVNAKKVISYFSGGVGIPPDISCTPLLDTAVFDQKSAGWTKGKDIPSKIILDSASRWPREMKAKRSCVPHEIRAGVDVEISIRLEADGTFVIVEGHGGATSDRFASFHNYLNIFHAGARHCGRFKGAGVQSNVETGTGKSVFETEEILCVVDTLGWPILGEL